MFSTGNKTVDAIGQIHLEGNIIPHEWFEHIRFDNGKPDLIGMIVLAEIVYWYRPTYVKDEATGQLQGVKKKFKADLLQRSYDSFAEQFGLSKKQVKEAFDRLEKIGVIQRQFRKIGTGSQTLFNVLFIDLNIELLKGITFEGSTVLTSTATPSPHRSEDPPTVEVGTNTEITTETTTENKKEKNSRKQVYDESSVHFQLANLLYEKIVLDDPSFKQPNMNAWADHIRLMIERDGRTVEQIKYLIEWSQANPFWKSNILSTKKLREKSTTLIRQIKAEKGGKAHESNQRSIRTAESTFGVALDF